MPYSPAALVVLVSDRLDERHAQKVRSTLGQKKLLVSWHLEPGGRWKARLSAPGLAHTIERTGFSRRRAIDRAMQALNRLPELRAGLARRRPQDPPSGVRRVE
jgi:hypothetical protein